MRSTVLYSALAFAASAYAQIAGLADNLFNDADRQKILDLHNSLRQQKNLSPLKWNADLEKSAKTQVQVNAAKNWDSNCNLPQGDDGHGTLTGAAFPLGLGQNHAFSSPDFFTPEKLITDPDSGFADTAEQQAVAQDPRNPVNGDHYWQILWYSTTDVACYRARNNAGKCDDVICDYYPPGNIVGTAWWGTGSSPPGPKSSSSTSSSTLSSSSTSSSTLSSTASSSSIASISSSSTTTSTASSYTNSASTATSTVTSSVSSTTTSTSSSVSSTTSSTASTSSSSTTATTSPEPTTAALSGNPDSNGIFSVDVTTILVGSAIATGDFRDGCIDRFTLDSSNTPAFLNIPGINCGGSAPADRLSHYFIVATPIVVFTFTGPLSGFFTVAYPNQKREVPVLWKFYFSGVDKVGTGCGKDCQLNSACAQNIQSGCAQTCLASNNLHVGSYSDSALAACCATDAGATFSASYTKCIQGCNLDNMAYQQAALPATMLSASCQKNGWTSNSMASPVYKNQASSYGNPVPAYNNQTAGYSASRAVYNVPSSSPAPAPAAVYNAPGTVYSAQGAVYSAPGTVYSAPGTVYSAPAPAYEPAPEYIAPAAAANNAPVYSAPAAAYSAPAAADYNAPAPIYSAPSPVYNVPADGNIYYSGTKSSGVVGGVAIVFGCLLL
ncbi:hypothetical protein BC830DRAFT_142385 [Chytriomyces sp. MP71]|nr:hypothetical protein BC830DRAFT_142385 [Chytriomyces sp. MP71]